MTEGSRGFTWPLRTNTGTGYSTDEQTGLAAQIGWNASPPTTVPFPASEVQSLADSLTSVSVHAHIYKNTVKRQHKLIVLYNRC
jgi:hypothetical protein